MGARVCIDSSMHEFLTTPVDELPPVYSQEDYLASIDPVCKVTTALFKSLITLEAALARIGFMSGNTAFFTYRELGHAVESLLQTPKLSGEFVHATMPYIEALYKCMNERSRVSDVNKLCSVIESMHGPSLPSCVLQQLDGMIRTDDGNGIDLSVLTTMHHIWAYHRIAAITLRAELTVEPKEMARAVGSGVKKLAAELAAESAAEATRNVTEDILTQTTKYVHDNIEETVAGLYTNQGDLMRRHDTIARGFDDLKTNVDDLRASVDGLRESMTELMTFVSDLRAAVVQIKAKQSVDLLSPSSSQPRRRASSPNAQPQAQQAQGRRRSSRWGSPGGLLGRKTS